MISTEGLPIQYPISEHFIILQTICRYSSVYFLSSYYRVSEMSIKKHNNAYWSAIVVKEIVFYFGVMFVKFYVLLMAINLLLL